jgi:integrase/recombinase XerD
MIAAPEFNSLFEFVGFEKAMLIVSQNAEISHGQNDLIAVCPDLAKQLTHIYEPRKVPIVLSPDEVRRMLEAAPGLKYKATLSVAYGAGLRVSEVVSLKVSDIDSKRASNGARSQGPQREALTGAARAVARMVEGLPVAGWLFPGQDPVQPMTTRQLTRACHMAAQAAEITKRVTPHTLRHNAERRIMPSNLRIA